MMAKTMNTQTTENKTNILIVSGNGNLRRGFDEGLTALGYQVFSAPDGESALGLLKQRRLDVAITSSELLGMNGIQLARAISRIHPNVPIIVMSSHPDPGLVAQSLSSGATDLVSDTIAVEELHSVIQGNLERKISPTRRIVSERAETLFKTIRIVTAAIDAKSHYAARHSSRVTQLSLMVGSRVGLTQEQLITLELSAQLHDIGKIGTPEAVLTKPDALTDEEWVDVLKHPTLGSTFLSAVPELSEVASAVRHHHEHFDGRGYPDGLQGEAIPLYSRIIAVADAYDATTSERPYRQAMSHDQAVNEIKQHSSTQFDPTMVEHLLVALDEEKRQRKAA